MEYNAGNPRFSLGDASGDKLTWDGDGALVIVAGGGNITLGSNGLIFAGDSFTSNNFRFERTTYLGTTVGMIAGLMSYSSPDVEWGRIEVLGHTGTPTGAWLNLGAVGGASGAYVVRMMLQADANNGALKIWGDDTNFDGVEISKVADSTALTGGAPDAMLDVHGTGYFGGLLTLNAGAKVGKLYPASDSTTALQITKANASTVVMNVDTSNARVGIGVTPSAPLHITGVDTAMNDPYGSLLITTGDAANRLIIGTRLETGALRYAFIQADQYGTGAKPLCLNANGGYVGVGVYNVAAPLTIGGADNAYDSGVGTIRIETADDTNKLVIGTRLSGGNLSYGYIQAQDSAVAKDLYLNPVSGARVMTGYDGSLLEIVPPYATNLSSITGTVSVDMKESVYQFTPSGNVTFNATGGLAGAICTFAIYTSGTTSRTITFGTNFRANSTIASGTTDAKFRSITFMCMPDGATWVEISRQSTSI
jgi:hypothetical protein